MHLSINGLSPSIYMRRLRLRDMSLSQRHTARRQWSWDLNPSVIDARNGYSFSPGTPLPCGLATSPSKRWSLSQGLLESKLALQLALTHRLRKRPGCGWSRPQGALQLPSPPSRGCPETSLASEGGETTWNRAEPPQEGPLRPALSG